MRLLNITATAHRDGNRIDLSWSFPPAQPTLTDPVGVRVLRGRNGYPAAPDDGEIIDEGVDLTQASDLPVQGETTHYYALFPFTGHPPHFLLAPQDDVHNRAAATATSPYDFAGLLYSLLPAIYHRYDTESPPGTATTARSNEDQGLLRRFLNLPGGELDRLYSHARTALAFMDPTRVDGRLLPLLAQWIGWRTDYRLPLETQRNEIRFAPRIYQSIGGVHVLDATVARVTGWTSRTKEFVHNVARTNQPERLNLWSALRDSHGTWSDPVLASVDFAYDGRPAVVPQKGNSARFFYHTRRLHGWDIWSKSLTSGDWTPSEPVVTRAGVDKYPTAAQQGDDLSLFWQGRDTVQPPEDAKWRVWFSVLSGKDWSPPTVFGDFDTERRMPAAAADAAGGLWLFWLEQEAGAWQLKYNRRDSTGWQLPTPAILPADGEDDPRVEDDLFVLFHPGSGTAKLWLFWARQEAAGEDQKRWHIAYRSKRGLDPSVSDWSPVERLTRQAESDHDRQPAALVSGDDTLELFWSSTRSGSWSIFQNTLNTESGTWETAQQLFAGPQTMRGPLAVSTTNGTLLLHRSNQSLEYVSTAFSATRTLDHRYAGTTTVDTRAKARLALRGSFEDFQTYLYDTGAGGIRTDGDRIARDTVGVYLASTPEPSAERAAKLSQLASTLGEFMPVTVRPVFITDSN